MGRWHGLCPAKVESHLEEQYKQAMFCPECHGEYREGYKKCGRVGARWFLNLSVIAPNRFGLNLGCLVDF
jgi:hypothetical protein